MKKITLLFTVLFLVAFSWQGMAQHFSEDFENAGAFPSGWTLTNGVDDWDIDQGDDFGPGAAQEGTYSAFFNDYDYSSSTEAEMITPNIDLSTATTPRLKFWYYDGGGSDVVEVLVSTDGSTYTLEYTTSGTVSPWTEIIVDLSSYVGSATVTISWKGTSVWGTSNPHVDNILVEETPTDTADWNNLQWPPTGAITTGDAYDVYSRVYEPGITDAVGQGAGIEAWIGYDTADTDPSAGGWTWIASTFNVDDGLNNDEYMAEIGSGLAAGTYYYVSRFRVNGGPFTYGGTGGFWANDSGVLTVTDPTGALCSDPIIVGALPYNTSDDTANYGDDYTGSPGATGCGTTSSYLNGDDVIYAYTATSDTSINIAMSAIGSTYSGIFVYTDCADIGTACVAGEANSGTTDRNFDLAVTNGTTYYIVISTWASPQSTTYTLDITENTCTNATVTYTIVDDCASSGGFLIDVEVTDMGTATDITVSNDQDATTFPVTSAPTTVQFGPYANATDVVITVVDDNDASCTQNSGAITQGACPPANDDCANATGITSLPYNEVVDASGATNNAGFISDCALGMNDGVWYTFTTINGGTVDIAITGVTGWDPEVALYSGSCGTFTCVASADSGATGGDETIAGATVAAGTQYWINVAYYSGSTDSSEGPFTIDISTSDTTTLPVSEYVFENFKYFPNPVNDNLNLRAQSNIQNVSIYNMLGQEVSRISPNAISSDVDMSALQTGVYFVNVTINDTTETIRIVKQ